MMILTERETLYLRMRSQQLSMPLNDARRDVPRVVKDVVGIQAQDLSAAALSVRARSCGLSLADVEKARQVDRSIIWTWALRGTLHLIEPADFHWFIPLLGLRFILGNRSRQQQLGLDEVTLEKGKTIILDVLSGNDPLTRAEIFSRLMQHGILAEGQRLPHLIFYVAMQGMICHGPDKDGEPTYVLADQWIGGGKLVGQEDGLSELARRYLAAFAPAGAEDLAAWSGASLGDARLGLAQIEKETVKVEAAGKQALMLKPQAEWLDGLPEATPVEPIVRLLPYFDTYLMGYASRDLIVDPVNWKRINRGGGMLHPTLLVDGRLVGVWSKKQSRDGILISVETFDTLDPALMPLVEVEAEDIARFLNQKVELRLKTL